MTRYVEDKFRNQYKATIGADFLSKSVLLNSTQVTFQIWDTAGPERFQSLGSAFYRGADGCLFMFDLTNRSTLMEIPRWCTSFATSANVSHIPYILVGTKFDKLPNGVIPMDLHDDIFKIADQVRAQRDEQDSDLVSVLYTSAKTGHNVGLLFDNLGESILNTVQPEPLACMVNIQPIAQINPNQNRCTPC
eukprot:TRINITY_DN903_c0_g1_i1.p1 TRINITY_DN903_c0_g1~~TRINITY_DN903_c0_g1_i1.p1  ORF type:complete len:191 (-),score=10.77 TRINITY_DN903_c0_g1_i1:626-1198(-)